MVGVTRSICGKRNYKLHFDEEYNIETNNKYNINTELENLMKHIVRNWS